MSEAKSLVVWISFANLCRNDSDSVRVKYSLGTTTCYDYEYAHDLSGRFLGVFREVQA